MPETTLRGLILDWGGVLTASMHSAVTAWAESDGIDVDTYVGIMRDWFGEPVGMEARLNPIHSLERGEMLLPDFETRLAAELTARSGREYAAEGLMQRLFERLEHVHDMAALVRRAKKSGISTALLSNSWGNDYPRDGWDEMFDVVVISGEVGMRKPEPRIYEHTLGLLGLRAPECVFVDDFAMNIEAAVELGLVGILHSSYEQTAAELEALFDRPLR